MAEDHDGTSLPAPGSPGPEAGAPAVTAIRKSYRELLPVEQGGRTARDGFDYQDHVAAGKCLDMLFGDGPSEVWCEAEDDIVLVWHRDSGNEEFEFVQVKGNNLFQAWTVARLCAADPGKDGAKKKSIFEKSLAHDRGRETCRFGIVTKWPPDELLDILTIHIGKRAPEALRAKVSAASAALVVRVGEVTSPNGNGAAFWTENTTWECRQSTDDVKNENVVRINAILHAAGESLAPDQVVELHASLLRKIQDASLASALTDPVRKRIFRDDLRSWLLARAREIQQPNDSGSAGRLRAKLEDAGADDAHVESARVMRLQYLRERRSPKYLANTEDGDEFESDVHVRLHELKTRLDAGQIKDEGMPFLHVCHEELKAFHQTLDEPRPPLGVVYGCLYDVMNRCLHRLSRPKT